MARPDKPIFDLPVTDERLLEFARKIWGDLYTIVARDTDENSLDLSQSNPQKKEKKK